ncbi:MAG TPA: single-stranded DNA-binding protein, partial [Sulfurovum sp.]|nr:single-stranded DNA-binding protein [Sulfurovum sp.]
DQWTAQDGSKRSKHSVTVENLQMLGSKDEAAPMGGNNYSQQGGSSYDAPAQNNYSQPSQPAQAAPQATQQPASTIPEIDINEDEIPF